MSEKPAEYKTNCDPADETPALIDPADDREAARFADELIAITTAERRVVEAAMAWL